MDEDDGESGVRNHHVIYHQNRVDPDQPAYYPEIESATLPGCVAQLVSCLTADPGVASLIPADHILSWRLILK